jgi:GntR family transcriptional regulator/MocR family aminotransferase
MKGTWATSASLDLHLELSGTRPRAALEAALRDAVRSGRLSAGTPLPSSRALAGDLGLARNTVADAYAQLVAEGWLDARHGSGTWVAERAARVPRARPPGDRVAPAPVRHDLRPGLPDVSAFPRAAWLAAARRALTVAPARDLIGYASPRGLLPLRQALAEYLARARGVVVTPDRIVVCAGFAQGLELLCDLLRAAGKRTLAVEAYGHEAHRRIAAAAGMRLAPVPVDDHGALLADGAGLPARTGAALLTPAHQYPLGVVLAPDRRRDAVDWAASSGGLIIEDDYDGEFRYDRQPAGALQQLDPERVIYVGTASKTLAPGLRLGWVAVPESLGGAAGLARQSFYRGTGVLEQLTLAELMTSGAFDRHIRRMRTQYRRRRDELASTLAASLPQLGLAGISAGLHALIYLPGHGPTEEQIQSRAARLSVAIHTLGAQAIIVGYATPASHAYRPALEALAELLAMEPDEQP